MAETPTPVTPGTQTTEYQVTKGSNAWSIVGLVIGLLITAGAAVAEALGAETNGGIIVGAGVSIAAILQRTFVDLGYIKSRTDVKTQ